ncbi:MAG: hypothetical protein KAX20_05430 [Candidatus Omnitrophica bacterium]|nr:hypothetical protein [Candidatus Omnitrophota bacterium]
MTKQQREIIMTVGLVCVLAIALSISFKSMKKSPKKKRAKKEVSVTKTKEAVAVKVSKKKPSLSKEIEEMQLARWKQNWKRDPFLLPADEKKKSILKEFSFSLSGIIWKEKEPLALIDDYIVREGDTVEGYTVVKIAQDKIILEEAGKKYQLFLGE